MWPRVCHHLTPLHSDVIFPFIPTLDAQVFQLPEPTRVAPVLHLRCTRAPLALNYPVDVRSASFFDTHSRHVIACLLRALPQKQSSPQSQASRPRQHINTRSLACHYPGCTHATKRRVSKIIRTRNSPPLSYAVETILLCRVARVIGDDVTATIRVSPPMRFLCACSRST